MYRGKRFLAIIPARSGSKGVPDKNIRPLQSKPLIQYSIQAAQDSGIIDRIFVSTDSERYAEIARQCGAEVPFLRPKQIAGDYAVATDYIIHAIESFQKLGDVFDYFALLQPTSPLRTGQDLYQAAVMLVDQKLTSVVSVCAAEHPIEYYNTLPPDHSLYHFNRGDYNRQELPIRYRINGALYLCSCEDYFKNRDFYGPNSKAFCMEASHSVDIDTLEDFELAEFYLNRAKKGKT